MKKIKTYWPGLVPIFACLVFAGEIIVFEE